MDVPRSPGEVPVLVVGCGHAGGSAAAETARLGFPTTIVGRRPAEVTSSALQRLVMEADHVTHQSLDLAQLSRHQLETFFAPFHWVVLADEPWHVDDDVGIESAIAWARARFRALSSSGFDEPGRFVVRIGSPAGERPDPTFPLVQNLPYVRLKQRLGAVAAKAAATGLNLGTVAPGEIHSPFSGLQPDPYRAALSGLAQLPTLHDLPVAAVSDRSLGEAVVAVAAVGRPGGWYQVADGSLGFGQALQQMAVASGVSPPALVRWTPAGANHVYEVLTTAGTLDLDLILSETDGWSREIEAALALRASNRGLAALSLWWAGSAARASAATALDAAAGDVGAFLLRSVGDQFTMSLLGVALALGPARGRQHVDEEASALRERWPELANRLELPLAPERAHARLLDATKRQAERSNM